MTTLVSVSAFAEDIKLLPGTSKTIGNDTVSCPANNNALRDCLIRVYNQGDELGKGTVKIEVTNGTADVYQWQTLVELESRSTEPNEHGGFWRVSDGKDVRGDLLEASQILSQLKSSGACN